MFDKYIDILKQRGLNKGRQAEDIVTLYNSIMAMEILMDKNNPIEFPPYLRDRRTNEEHIIDLIEGRFFEDILKLLFEKAGCVVLHQGHDKTRSVLREWSTVTTKQDLIVNNQKVEIQMARKKLDKYHIKENKMKRLCRDNSCLFMVIIETGQYFTIRKESLDYMNKGPNPARGGKITYSISHKELESLGLVKELGDLV